MCVERAPQQLRRRVEQRLQPGVVAKARRLDHQLRSQQCRRRLPLGRATSRGHPRHRAAHHRRVVRGERDHAGRRLVPAGRGEQRGEHARVAAQQATTDKQAVATRQQQRHITFVLRLRAGRPVAAFQLAPSRQLVRGRISALQAQRDVDSRVVRSASRWCGCRPDRSAGMPPLSHLWVERGQRSGHNDCMGALDRKMEPHSLDDSVGSQRHRHALPWRFPGVYVTK